MSSSEAERLAEACIALHTKVSRLHAEGKLGELSAEDCAQLSYLLGVTSGQASRIEQLTARVRELSSALQLLAGVRVS